MFKYDKLDRKPISLGIDPDNLLKHSHTVANAVRLDIVEGKDPDRKLLFR